MLPPFEIHEPTTPDEAATLRARFGETAALYAGGSELILAMKEGLGDFAHLIDVKTIPALHQLELAGDGTTLVVGAAITHRALERTPLVCERFPLLAEAERQVGNARVRAMGTLGGNLCFAEPHSDPPTVLLIHDATVILHGTGGVRRMALAQFLVGPYETALRADEIMTRIEVPAAPPRSVSAYLKFGMHERPTVGVAVLLVPDEKERAIAEALVSVGCVGPVATRLPELEAQLIGVPLAVLESGWAPAERAGATLDAVSDLHGSADYKLAMSGVFVKRALVLAARRARILAA
jgi:aerobic carbon-monoxide dehydrogenase medium subunit